MICATPAVVLRTFDFRETSKIAVFFTRDFGKVKGVLKGIRRDPRKFGSSLPVLSLNHIIFYKKRHSEIHLIGQCDLLDDFQIRGDDLESFSYAHFCAELLDVIMPLEDPHPGVFGLVLDFLNAIKKPPQDMRSVFMIKILSLSGFKPHFDACLSCQSRLSGEAFFSLKKGGLLCRKCLAADFSATSVLPGAVASILYMERSSWADCLRLKLMPGVRRQLEEVLHCFLHYHVGRSLKTRPKIHDLLEFLSSKA
ncbi:MAG: DNA repair protein RecO [Candidatus Omnitrophica bacterium]|nr:DNA repair protein RecO [Candidatus Omnitrophota bacterium]MDD5574915.1 DNA repair protein RecO [Candidatus Omnitrophota bacterium]